MLIGFVDGSFLGTMGRLVGVKARDLVGGELARTVLSPPVGRLVGQDEGNWLGTLDGVLLGRNPGVDVLNLSGGELARKVGPLGRLDRLLLKILVKA
jgi:hypothetical protein